MNNQDRVRAVQEAFFNGPEFSGFSVATRKTKPDGGRLDERCVPNKCVKSRYLFHVWKIEPAAAGAAGAADSGMSSPSARNRERILEAIDQLRKRKARPDVARICSYLFRRFHVNSVEAKADLEWCVANSIVLKVEYKGNISYRNAAKKWAQMRHREAQGHSATPNSLSKLAISRNFMELLTNVFGELVVEEPDYLEIGVPPKEIIENILTKDSVRYTRNYIAILLIKETERGNLIKLANGHFLLGPCADDRRQEWMTRETEQKLLPATCRDGQTVSSKRSYNDHSSAVQIQADAENSRQAIVKPKKRMIAKVQAAAQRQESLERQARMYAIEDKHCEGRADSIRSGGRRKKARKVFDPSDTHVPKKRGRPAGSLNKNTIEKQHVFKVRDEDSRPNSRSSTSSNHGGVCSVCHTQSKKGPSDRMVSCSECSNKGHLQREERTTNNPDRVILPFLPEPIFQYFLTRICIGPRPPIYYRAISLH
ncbi:hypothetical protein D910_10822 [Dendroctonus ponderosae]|uniref:SAMD1-like winged helix (WH) domain-containing protein n=1 Tax=Dendroctonus ponderosae TaxID=77166 RepID=U4UM26_DENPD|nr:hypothetical protein D910_10822 [Dendroctonus ponderosae]